MKALIAGPGKSGTSALTYRIAADLAALGYADDWTLANPQTLDPSTGSDYVAGLRGGPWTPLVRTLRRLALRTLPPPLGRRR